MFLPIARPINYDVIEHLDFGFQSREAPSMRYLAIEPGGRDEWET